MGYAGSSLGAEGLLGAASFVTFHASSAGDGFVLVWWCRHCRVTTVCIMSIIVTVR